MCPIIKVFPYLNIKYGFQKPCSKKVSDLVITLSMEMQLGGFQTQFLGWRRWLEPLGKKNL